MIDFTLCYWVLDFRDQTRFYLDWQTGEQLQAKLETRQQDDANQPMFLTAEDVTGAPLTFRVDWVSVLWASTPEIRAREADPVGALEQIRSYSKVLASRKWGEDAEPYQ